MNGTAATILETVTTVNELLRSALAQTDSLLTDEQLLEIGELNEQLTARTHALTTRTLASIDTRDTAQHVHGVRTTTWMRERHGYASNHAAGCCARPAERYRRRSCTALVARDDGCVFPGCDQPARRCDGHHIRPWVWGGPTSLDNGVLLCSHRHALVEPSKTRLHNANRWEVRINPADRLPEFLPPSRLDRCRPRRHLRHRLRQRRIGDDDGH